MADLFERLFPAGSEVENIAIHSFHAAVVDYIAGETTRAQIVSYWSLDSEAETDLDNFLDAADALSGITNKLAFAAELDAVMKMGEEGAKYTTKLEFKTRLGLS